MLENTREFCFRFRCQSIRPVSGFRALIGRNQSLEDGARRAHDIIACEIHLSHFSLNIRSICMLRCT